MIATLEAPTVHLVPHVLRPTAAPRGSNAIAGERAARFVQQRTGVELCLPLTAMAVETDGLIICGAAFNSFSGFNVNLTVAGHGWTRGFISEIGHYAFNTLKCIRMTALIEQPETVLMAERLGGAVEAVMRNHFGKGRDAIVVGILKEDWKF